MKESQNYIDEDIEQLLLYLKDGDLETNFKLDKPLGKVFEIYSVKLFKKNTYLNAILRNMVVKNDE